VPGDEPLIDRDRRAPRRQPEYGLAPFLGRFVDRRRDPVGREPAGVELVGEDEDLSGGGIDLAGERGPRGESSDG
jgi:hypothetical protein